MESLSKSELRKLKDGIASELTSMRDSLSSTYGYALQDTDPRILAYVLKVIDDPDGHNLYELAKVRRFFHLLDRHQWNGRRVMAKIRFYEMIRFSGMQGRQRYKLTPVQCFQFAHIFGFAREDGRRLIRTAYIFVPRKFSKTTFAAFLAVDDMLFGDNNAEAYIGANSYDQAKKCFNEVRAIMFDLDPKQKHFRINRESVSFRDRGRDSLIQCLTANARTKDGLFASLAILDEYAQARDTGTRSGGDLKSVLTTSMGPRREPLTVIITTASDVIDGACYQEIEGCKAVLRGELENDTLFADLFLPDVDDAEDDPRTWAKVHPHIGVTVQPDFYEAAWKEAQMSSQGIRDFRNKLLNIFAVSDTKTWFTPDKAKTLLGDWDVDYLADDRTRTDLYGDSSVKPTVFVAFDLSVRDDFSAVSYTTYSPLRKCFYCHTDYYFPEGALAGHPNRELYAKWHDDGYLSYCHGDKIDTRKIADDIIRRSRFTSIVRIGYDAYKSQELVNTLIAGGARNQLMPYKQTYGSFNLPVESFELMAWSDPPKIVLNDNPINTFCLSNCVIDEDRLENKKPVKITATRKIDGVITMLMTIGQLNSYEY